MADFDTLIRFPVTGEAWSVSGSWETAPSGGRQFRATRATPREPAGEEIVRLFSLHPTFGVLTPRAARNLWSQLSAEVYSALSGGDVATLIRAGLAPQLALSLPAKWKAYRREIAVIQWLTDIKLTGRDRQRSYRILEYLAAIDLTNPYHAFPLLSWSTVSKHADALKKNYVEQRYITACEAACFRDGAPSATSRSYASIVRSLKRRLGNEDVAQCALSLALRRKRLTVVKTASGDRYATTGVAIIMHKLVEAVRRCMAAQSGPISPTSHGLPAMLIDDWTHLAAFTLLTARHRSALHIVPFDQPAHYPEDTNVISFRRLFSRSDNRLRFEHAVVHRAESIDLFSLSKLLHHIPEHCTVTLVGRESATAMTDEHCPFQALIRSGHFSTEKLHHPSASNAGAKLPTKALEEHASIQGATVEWVKSDGTIDELLAQYRVAAEAGSVVIVTNDSQKLANINILLQNELVDELRVTSRSNRSVRLDYNFSATCGTPVTWKRRNLSQSRWPGEIGRVIEIFTRPTLALHGEFHPVALLARGEFSGRPEEMSAADLSELVAAFALSPWHAALGAWDTVIVDCSLSNTADFAWVSGAAHAANLKVIFVIEDEAHQAFEMQECETSDPMLTHLLASL
ncbi:hypothetical protein EHZ19_16170 [Paraburkholderia bannensis]|nr:hypothetical protein [Paraburkholderia bannensis]RQM47187.1 hypothetical protein EHZ19_16170 [Paraburkholderia bannensis]